MRAAAFLAGLMIVVVACSSSSEDDDTTPYSGDPLAAIQAECEFRLDGKGCDGPCIEAALNINSPAGESCPGAEDLFSGNKLDAYFDCRDQCDVAMKCSGRDITLRDCACGRDCAAKLPKRVQGMLAYYSDCARALEACQ
jgi:hypothetical protein